MPSSKILFSVFDARCLIQKVTKILQHEFFDRLSPIVSKFAF